MAIDLGGGGHSRPRPTMNVTPLVDVVLVLLIIFMVITPMMVKQLSVNVPVDKDKDEQKQEEPDTVDADKEPQVVLFVKSDGRAYLNRKPVADQNLAVRLKRVFAARSDQTLFFDAADDVPFGRALQVLDIARGIGLETIAVLTEPVGV
jgi:biopolymer transport protein ExbD